MVYGTASFLRVYALLKFLVQSNILLHRRWPEEKLQRLRYISRDGILLTLKRVFLLAKTCDIETVFDEGYMDSDVRDVALSVLRVRKSMMSRYTYLDDEDSDEDSDIDEPTADAATSTAAASTSATASTSIVAATTAANMDEPNWSTYFERQYWAYKNEEARRQMLDDDDDDNDDDSSSDSSFASTLPEERERIDVLSERVKERHNIWALVNAMEKEKKEEERKRSGKKEEEKTQEEKEKEEECEAYANGEEDEEYMEYVEEEEEAKYCNGDDTVAAGDSIEAYATLLFYMELEQ